MQLVEHEVSEGIYFHRSFSRPFSALDFRPISTDHSSYRSDRETAELTFLISLLSACSAVRPSFRSKPVLLLGQKRERRLCRLLRALLGQVMTGGQSSPA